MRRVLVPTVLLAAMLALSAPAQALLPTQQPYRIDPQGRLVTDVHIDGQGPFSFVIDTASSRSLMFEHVRARLGLARSQPGQLLVYGINDVADAMPVKPQELRVAGETVSGLTLAVLPAVSSGGSDGVLGVDVLARYFVVLDREKMLLKLLPPGETSARDFRKWSQAELLQRPFKKFAIEFWYLRTRFNGQMLTALFDMGAGFTMMNWRAAERLGARKAQFAHYGAPPELLQDVLGKKAPAVRMEEVTISIAGKEWRKQLVIIADAPVFDYFDLEEAPAVIVGPGLLGDTSLAIDFAGKRLYIGPTLD
jgi:predicted aspartyl protease